MVQIINNIEQKMIGRRHPQRGYDEGKYKYILDNKALLVTLSFFGKGFWAE